MLAIRPPSKTCFLPEPGHDPVTATVLLSRADSSVLRKLSRAGDRWTGPLSPGGELCGNGVALKEGGERKSFEGHEALVLRILYINKPYFQGAGPSLPAGLGRAQVIVHASGRISP